MAVQVQIPTILRPQVGGAKTVEAAPGTLAEVIADLASRHDGLGAKLLTDTGELHRFINIYRNDEDVRFLGALATPVADGDQLTILPAVAGG